LQRQGCAWTRCRFDLGGDSNIQGLPCCCQRGSFRSYYPYTKDFCANLILFSSLIRQTIVDHIITFILASSARFFASIASVSLVSSYFRKIALRLFFSTITASTRTRWSKLWNVLAFADRDGDYTNGPHTWIRYVGYRHVICTFLMVPLSLHEFIFRIVEL
jgi:hypothetical protein